MFPSHQSELAIAIVAGLGGMLGWGFADFFAKKTIDSAGDIVTLTWAHLFGTVAFLALSLLRSMLGYPLEMPQGIGIWLILILFGILQALVYLLLYRGFGKGQLAILNPVFSSFSGITALVSIAIIGETARGGQWLVLAMMFAGIMALSLDIRALSAGRIHFTRLPGLPEVAAATGIAAVWTLGWNTFIEGKDWVFCAGLMYAFMTAAILIVAFLRRTNLVLPKGIWLDMVLIGFCETAAYCAISFGYSLTSRTSVVALISGAFSLPTLILARFFLKERVDAVQGAGIAMIVGSVALLAVL
jgi:drug/metabolite transporter (DMT)-like permease